MSTQTATRSESEREAVLGMAPSDLADQTKPAEVFQPVERETYFRISDESETVAVSTNQKGIAQRLVRHPEFEVEHVTTNGSGQRLSTHTPPLSGLSDPVVRVEGQLPVSHLKVLWNGRDRLTPSHIVTEEVYR